MDGEADQLALTEHGFREVDLAPGGGAPLPEFEAIEVSKDDPSPLIDPRPHTEFIGAAGPVAITNTVGAATPDLPTRPYSTRGAADPADLHPSLRDAEPTRFNFKTFEADRIRPHQPPVRRHPPIFTYWHPVGRERRPACNTRRRGTRRVTRAGPPSDDDPHEQSELVPALIGGRAG